MRKLILAIIAAISIPAIALAQAADAKAKAEQILKQARAAIGDEKKLKELQAISITGTQRQTFGERQMENEIQLDLMMPDKSMLTTNGQFGTRINTLNGDQVWNDFIPAMSAGGGGGFMMRMGGPGGGAGGGNPNPQMAEYFQLQQRRDHYLVMIGFLLAAPPVAQLQYSYLGEAPGPEGSKLDVLEGKGANNLALRLYFDQQSHHLIGVIYKAKNMRQMMGGRGPGGQGRDGGRRPPQGQAQAQPQGGGQGNAQGGGQRPQGQRPELTPEERERRMKEFQERFEKAPEVDYRWEFAEYKSVGGLNLPHRVTKSEGGTPNEEWTISKIKINPKLSPDKFVKKEKPPSGN